MRIIAIVHLQPLKKWTFIIVIIVVVGVGKIMVKNHYLQF